MHPKYCPVTGIGVRLLPVLLFPAMLCGYSCGKKTYHHQVSTNRMIPVNISGTVQDTSIAALLAHYTQELERRLSDTLIINIHPLTKAQPESSLGNCITDAVRAACTIKQVKTDIVLITYGSLEKSYLPPGPLLRKDVYEMIPYENNLERMLVSGVLLRRICDTIAAQKGMPVSGISFRIENNRATDIRCGQYPVNDHLVYSIVFNDYLLRHPAFRFLAYEKIPHEPIGFSLRGLFLEYLEEQHRLGARLSGQTDQRIEYAE